MFSTYSTGLYFVLPGTVYIIGCFFEFISIDLFKRFFGLDLNTIGFFVASIMSFFLNYLSISSRLFIFDLFVLLSDFT